MYCLYLLGGEERSQGCGGHGKGQGGMIGSGHGGIHSGIGSGQGQGGMGSMQGVGSGSHGV